MFKVQIWPSTLLILVIGQVESSFTFFQSSDCSQCKLLQMLDVTLAVLIIWIACRKYIIPSLTLIFQRRSLLKSAHILWSSCNFSNHDEGTKPKYFNLDHVCEMLLSSHFNQFVQSIIFCSSLKRSNIMRN